VWPLPDRLQDATPVRPLRDTGLAGGVSLIGLVPNLGATSYAMYLCQIWVRTITQCTGEVWSNIARTDHNLNEQTNPVRTNLFLKKNRSEN
jgi:hypothetical protein